MPEAPRLRELELLPGYDSGSDALTQFYVPALERATDYRRSAGYFRSSSLAVAARGLSRFVAGGGRMKLLVGTDLTAEDCVAIEGGATVPDSLAERLAEGLATEDDFESQRLAVLAWLAQQRRLFVRVAYPVDSQGRPLRGEAGYFHEKIGVLRDSSGDGVAFNGSANESAAAWQRNFESLSVYRSWEELAHFDHWSAAFDQRWAGRIPGWKVVDLPKAVKDRLISYAPAAPPGLRDPEEPPEIGNPATVAAWLQAAPTMVGSEALAEATSGVTPFPHQRQVVERLAGEYPRSWLVADEVGLGKTISAGLALRRLVIQGRVRRVLILAPANVCTQWQDELFEKFGLWVDRLDGGWWRAPHPRDDEQRRSNENPYAERDMLIVSSHLARRSDHQQRVIEAGPWDLVIVDEAHHARRKREHDQSRYRPSRLLELLDKLSDAQVSQATWLLTATPMQVDPLELHDLLRHVDLNGALAEPANFASWYERLGRDPSDADLQWFHRTMLASPHPPLGRAERAFLAKTDHHLGPVVRSTLERFGTEGLSNPELAVAALGQPGRNALIRWVRLRGPVGRCVTRHTRTTLKDYRDRGLLKEPIADRVVTPVLIDFSADEQRLYKELDELIDRLLDAHGTRSGAGFVLTVYRRRLTSSWDAIRETLRRRLDGSATLEGDDDLVDEAESEDLGDIPDDSQAVPLSQNDRDDIEQFLRDIDEVDDSKFRQLRADLDEARAAGRGAIVFTQFTDTLIGIRDRLRGVYTTELATFTGEGGRIWDQAEGWVPIAKHDLVDAIRSGEVTVLLANDAASEGLNLQACSFLINFDMPWNPMRAEQRIGRIDRIGQTAPKIEVRNYFIPGTVEERVYELLADRIDGFSDLLGNLQPILGATEDAFRATFRAPRSERAVVAAEQLGDLDRQIDELRSGGIELSVEDPMPIPEHPEPAVDLRRLSELLRHCGIQLGYADRPVTSDPDGASRDREDWRALATYGHPDLEGALRRVEGEVNPSLVFGTAGTEDEHVRAARRADVDPPATLTTEDLGDLGATVAVDTAASAADAEAAEEARRRLEHLRATVLSRAVRTEQALADRFQRLVHRLIAAEVARARRAGEQRDPLTIWSELVTDTATGWVYAKQFAATLRLTPTDLAPGWLTEDDACPAHDLDRFHRHHAYAELHDIMTEWRNFTESLT